MVKATLLKGQITTERSEWAKKEWKSLVSIRLKKMEMKKSFSAQFRLIDFHSTEIIYFRTYDSIYQKRLKRTDNNFR